MKRTCRPRTAEEAEQIAQKYHDLADDLRFDELKESLVDAFYVNIEYVSKSTAQPGFATSQSFMIKNGEIVNKNFYKKYYSGTLELKNNMVSFTSSTGANALKVNIPLIDGYCDQFVYPRNDATLVVLVKKVLTKGNIEFSDEEWESKEENTLPIKYVKKVYYR